MLLAGVPLVFLYKSENFGFTFKVDGSLSSKNQLRPRRTQPVCGIFRGHRLRAASDRQEKARQHTVPHGPPSWTRQGLLPTLLPTCSCRLDTTVIQNTALEALRESGLTKDFQVGMAPEAAEKLQSEQYQVFPSALSL